MRHRWLLTAAELLLSLEHEQREVYRSSAGAVLRRRGERAHLRLGSPMP